MFEEDVENIRKFIKVFQDLPEIAPNVVYAWIPPFCPINRVDEYFQKFPEDKVINSFTKTKFVSIIICNLYTKILQRLT